MRNWGEGVRTDGEGDGAGRGMSSGEGGGDQLGRGLDEAMVMSCLHVAS